jgi:ribosomal subunit interface protein
MIKLQTTGRHYELDPKIVAYVERKLGSLDRYLPKGSRSGLFGQIVLEHDPSHTKEGKYICEAKIDVKGEILFAKEATMSIYAAIDICEQKLKHQVLEYKSKREPARNRGRRLIAKIVGREPIPAPSEEQDSSQT